MDIGGIGHGFSMTVSSRSLIDTEMSPISLCSAKKKNPYSALDASEVSLCSAAKKGLAQWLH